MHNIFRYTFIRQFVYPYFCHIHRAHDVGVECSLHILRAGGHHGAMGKNPCIVDQQIETACPQQRAYLLGRLLYAGEVIDI